MKMHHNLELKTCRINYLHVIYIFKISSTSIYILFNK